MKRKILFSVMTIALVGALVGVGVHAYFSDTETSPGNTFTAGTLDLEVDSENPWTSTPITVTCMEPGATSNSVNITAENIGCLDGDLFMRLTAVTDSGNVTTEPECVAESGTWTNPSGPCNGNTPVDDVSTQITLHCSCGGSPVSGIDGVTLAIAEDTWSSKIADLTENGTATITISATFNSGAGNEYQGDQSTFTIELYLAQDGQSHP
jgi:predicted ribosomally synthesized peptide with SipW-like signal peptide